MSNDTRTLKFAADRMLGRLAKWLRAIGQDVIYGRQLSGYGLIHAARREGRVILTRDRGLTSKNPPEFLLIESDRYPEQLRQVIERFDLRPLTELFTRCLECNGRLQPLAKASVEEKVPPYVFSTQDKFSCCPQCRRIYWPATHQQRMLDDLDRWGLR